MAFVPKPPPMQFTRTISLRGVTSEYFVLGGSISEGVNMETISHTLDSKRENSDAAETVVIEFARRARLTKKAVARSGLAVREISQTR